MVKSREAVFVGCQCAGETYCRHVLARQSELTHQGNVWQGFCIIICLKCIELPNCGFVSGSLFAKLASVNCCCEQGGYCCWSSEISAGLFLALQLPTQPQKSL